MEICDILLETNRFNLSLVKQHFINACCFGEDLAQWLVVKLVESGVKAGMPYQEDWGWEFSAADSEHSYYVGVGGNSFGSEGEPNKGEWRVMISKRRSLLEMLTGKNKLQQGERLVTLVYGILEKEQGFSNIHFETRT